RREALGLLDVLRPLGVTVDWVDRNADDLHAALVELRLDLGHVAKLCRADRSEVLRMRKQDRPAIADPVVELDFAFGGLRLEIGRRIANGKCHLDLLSCRPGRDYARFLPACSGELI